MKQRHLTGLQHGKHANNDLLSVTVTSMYIYSDFQAELWMKYQTFLRLIKVCCNICTCKYRDIHNTVTRVYFRSIKQKICLKCSSDINLLCITQQSLFTALHWCPFLPCDLNAALKQEWCLLYFIQYTIKCQHTKTVNKWETRRPLYIAKLSRTTIHLDTLGNLHVLNHSKIHCFNIRLNRSHG